MAAEVTVRWLGADGVSVGTLADIDKAVGTPSVWIDVARADEASLVALAAYYPLHPLTIEDCLHFPQRPKIDVYEDSVFLVWVTPHGESGGAELQEIDVFLGDGWLITAHQGRSRALEALAEEAAIHLPRGADWLLHAIVDRLVDDVFPVLDAFGDQLDEIQDEMLEHAEHGQLERLYVLRRQLLHMHKTIAPERDSLRVLVRERNLVSEEAYRYFQDVADHLARVEDTIDTYREVATGATDIYLSAQSNRMNAIMKHLTIVATIFMPLTLITGIYGMNFRILPELGWRYGYFGVLVAMVMITAGMLIFFKKRDWW
ncbi:MAG: magnesium/cobalt transporter CorA [Coriobacteriia bacterium]|nr:magnesium/cobalt transporter CorA [Coriobacteriia bacterium]